VWDATLNGGSIAPAILLSEDDGPLPIGAQYFGITAPDDELPTNLAELEEHQATFGPDTRAGRFMIHEQLVEGGAGPPPAPDLEFGRPDYFPGDQWLDFSTKSAGYITSVQQALVGAGLLRDKELVEGIWTVDAAVAMETAMLIANSTGGTKSWAVVLQELSDGLEAAGNAPGSTGRSPLAGRVLTLPTYVEPDLASIEAQVKESFQRQLGRDAMEWELALLGEQLSTDHRAAFDVETQALTAEFEAGNRGILSGGPAIVDPGSVQGVDPVGRLTQRIEDRYSAEIEFGDDRQTERQNMSNVYNVLTQMSQLMSGGVR
jgi:hypothetical protein